ncbi:hypothetical protein RUM43_011454 [Polyplax serrata]|uniref:Secreted protein n=1 Tax=Polyplax serrata TaxID=468196 RepID=A0AAN8PUN6_POLSC
MVTEHMSAGVRTILISSVCLHVSSSLCPAEEPNEVRPTRFLSYLLHFLLKQDSPDNQRAHQPVGKLVSQRL